MTIAQLKELAKDNPVAAAIYAQVISCSNRSTKDNKPYLELAVADSSGRVTLKIWSDSKVYQLVKDLPKDAVIRLDAKWSHSQYGIEPRELSIAEAGEHATEAFFAPEPHVREQQARDFAQIEQFVASLSDPRLKALCSRFLEQLGERFRRTAAAKRNHHARRGGLVEHVAQMMRVIHALAAAYPELNRNLLLTGALFHDAGKLWENSYPEQGFNQTLSLHGEMLGHIPLGIELINRLWRDVFESPQAVGWRDLQPSSEDTRLHLLHLIGSHHGEYAFGSPVLPRTPEAFALHYVDNLDAKLEMLRESYAQSTELAPGIFERSFPLPTNLVRPLPHFSPPS